MDLKRSQWKFDKKVADVFDEHVRQSVPMYEEIHNLVADLSCWFVSEGSRVYDIGTSTGEALYNIYTMHEKKFGVGYIGVDTSPSMIEKAMRRFSGIQNVTLLDSDVREVTITNASFVTSILTMQFIHPTERQSIASKIYSGLNKGGAFVLVEKIVGNTTRIDQMYTEMYHDLKIQNGLSADHVIDKARSLRGIQRPNTVDENMNMLRRAGFTDIDIFFKWANFAGFIATK